MLFRKYAGMKFRTLNVKFNFNIFKIDGNGDNVLSINQKRFGEMK